MNAVTKSPTHDIEQAKRFLKALGPSATKFTFTLFSDDKSSLKPPRTLHTTLDEAWPTIFALNQPDQGYGVFVAVNEAKDGDRKNIVRVRALYADADEPEQVKTVLAAIKAAGVGMSMVVKSSPGKMHVYWLVDGAPPEQMAQLQKTFVGRVGADQRAKDLARVLRLPGTLHLKGSPQPVTLREGPLRRYTGAEIVEAFGLEPSNVIPLDRTQRASVWLGEGALRGGPARYPVTLFGRNDRGK